MPRQRDAAVIVEATSGSDEECSLLIELSHDVACFIDSDGRMERVNSSWRACLGWTDLDVLGRRFLDFVHADDRAATEFWLGRIAGGGARGLEFRLRGKDGAHRRLNWNAAFSPSRGRICAMARDMTAELRLERELIEARDREKERIGRELHDGLCQNLAGMAALSATLARKLAARSDPAASAAAELTALLQQSVGDARELARGLDWAGLRQLGLVVALDHLAANVDALHPVACTLSRDRRFPRLDPLFEAHLYRIAQEAVSNVLTHAKATRIVIRLRFKRGRASLEIQDNGVGVSDQTIASGGMGLRTMAYRARLIGAEFHVRRAKTRGTLVACEISVDPATTRARRSDPGVLDNVESPRATHRVSPDGHPRG